MKTLTHNEVNVTTLEDDCKCEEGVEIFYALYQFQTPHRNYYAIEISTKNEAEMQILGCQSDRAHHIYELMIREMVTPCTLADIAHDIREDKKRSVRL